MQGNNPATSAVVAREKLSKSNTISGTFDFQKIEFHLLNTHKTFGILKLGACSLKKSQHQAQRSVGYS